MFGRKAPVILHPAVTLGTTRGGTARRPVVLGPRELALMKRIRGKSGFGKSSLLASVFVQLLHGGQTAVLIDPHTDLAQTIIGILLDSGYFSHPDALSRLLYIDWSRRDRIVPFNVLSQPQLDAYTVAGNVNEVFKRAWPALDGGAAPLFEVILLSSIVVLVENQLSLTSLLPLLTNKPYRDQLLRRVSDPQVVSFFKERYDVWGKGVMIESVARRLHLLTFHPVLRQSLGHPQNRLNLRHLMDAGVSVIHDLGGLDEEAQRFIGALLMVGLEQAALSRADLPAAQRRPVQLLVDEFSSFSATSAEAFERILAQTRKYGLYLWLSHQTDSQVGHSLHGALGNLEVDIAFRLSDDDAKNAAGHFTHFDPKAGTLAQQRQDAMLALTELGRQQAVVRINDQILPLLTLSLPSYTAAPARLQEVLDRYAESLGVPSRPLDESVESGLVTIDAGQRPPEIARAVESREERLRVQYIEDDD